MQSNFSKNVKKWLNSSSIKDLMYNIYYLHLIYLIYLSIHLI